VRRDRLWWPVLALLGGCGDRLVDGRYKGQATLQIHGEMTVPGGRPSAPAGGAIWLGYSALVEATPALETTVLPVSDVEFPPDFVCDVLSPPLSTGRYAWPGQIIPAFIRVARLIVVDDVNQDGRFKIDVAGGVQPPDRLLAAAADAVLLFVDRLPDDPSLLDGAFLDNWEDAVLGYNLVELDPGTPPPSLTGRIVPSDTRVVFGQPSPAGGP
jgi:hypothetical protein